MTYILNPADTPEGDFFEIMCVLINEYENKQSGKASIELYVDVEGIDRSGVTISRRIVASDPQGQAHFTAFGIVRVIEAMLEKTVKGFIFPEQLLNYEAVLTMMKDTGIVLAKP